MKHLTTLMRALRNDWREIDSAPVDRELELAFFDETTMAMRGSCLRHGDGWLDADTLRPVDTVATHWRHRRPIILPVSCC